MESGFGSLLLVPTGVEAGSFVMVLKSLMGSIKDGSVVIWKGVLKSLMGSSLSFVSF